MRTSKTTKKVKHHLYNRHLIDVTGLDHLGQYRSLVICFYQDVDKCFPLRLHIRLKRSFFLNIFLDIQIYNINIIYTYQSELAHSNVKVLSLEDVLSFYSRLPFRLT